ncbi:MAG: hypothetical protein ACOC45_09220 [Alkalispirochaetaceae bacterium]
MTPLDNRNTTLGAILLGAALLISLISIFLFPPQQSRRVLFFPNGVTGELGGEEHLLPAGGGREAQIGLFLEELILGPNTLGAVRILPEDTEVALLMLRDRELYVDFSPEILAVEEQGNLSFDDVLEMTRYNIEYNFPYLRSVTVTVAGQLPGEPLFGISRIGINR